MSTAFDIVVLPGDGIGIEVTDAALAVLDRAQARFGFRLAHDRRPGGAHLYKDTGIAFPDASMRASERADAILFGAMGWPDIRYPDGTEIAPQLDLRVALDLYAGVRPIRAIPGLPLPLAAPEAAKIDFVIVRESTEGWFHARGQGRRVTNAAGDEAVQDTCEISRRGCERLFDFAFRLAERRARRDPAKGRVTLIDKSNVFLGMAFMNAVFRERAARYPRIAADHCYIDAYCLNLIRKPWDYDVCPMENQFGDITSDLGAGLVCGMGYAPSADIGDRHALFQPSHGSAPDIAGRGIANPTAAILSAAMMLDWLGERRDAPHLCDAARSIEAAVDTVFRERRVRPADIGGGDGTGAVTRAICEALR
ncbi:MAG: isocitrate/isopropylmalate dehydrogenase family protein [Burkholderiales bacterium]|nr:isocitrate/isopropylmalate dehydrogenase family protein [Burkholderiales bacterium]